MVERRAPPICTLCFMEGGLHNSPCVPAWGYGPRVKAVLPSLAGHLETVTWQDVMRALEHNAGLYANDAPHYNEVDLKRELRRWCKQARKILAKDAANG